MQSGRVPCHDDEQTVDLPRDRTMVATLHRTARRAISADVRQRCLTTAQMLERAGVTLVDQTPAQLSTEQFGAFDGEDRKLLVLSALVRDMCAPENAPSASELPEILIRGALRRLYRRAVRDIYRHHRGPRGYIVKTESLVAAHRRSRRSGVPARLLDFLPRLNADGVIPGARPAVDVQLQASADLHLAPERDDQSELRTPTRLVYLGVPQAVYGGETRALLLGVLVDGSRGRDVDFAINRIRFAVRQLDLSSGPAVIRQALMASPDLELHTA